jgi:hypothetical protein
MWLYSVRTVCGYRDGSCRPGLAARWPRPRRIGWRRIADRGGDLAQHRIGLRRGGASLGQPTGGGEGRLHRRRRRPRFGRGRGGNRVRRGWRGKHRLLPRRRRGRLGPFCHQGRSGRNGSGHRRLREIGHCERGRRGLRNGLGRDRGRDRPRRFDIKMHGRKGVIPKRRQTTSFCQNVDFNQERGPPLTVRLHCWRTPGKIFCINYCQVDRVTPMQQAPRNLAGTSSDYPRALLEPHTMSPPLHSIAKTVLSLQKLGLR